VTETEPVGDNNLAIEVAREGVFSEQDGQRRALPLSERVELALDQKVGVDESGRAILHFGNVLTVELLQAGELQVQQFSVSEQGTTVALSQNGGVLIADLTPSLSLENRLTIQTAFATITASGTRLAVIHETNSPLEWILALEAEQDDLQVSAGGVTQAMVGGQARWVGPAGKLGPVVKAGQNVEVWLEAVRNSSPDTEIGEVLLPPANMLADISSLTILPAPGEPVELGRDIQGAIELTLDPQGIFGRPGYTLEDCSGDGGPDIALLNGILRLDFEQVQARVQALDVFVFNRGQPGHGSVQGLDLAGTELARQQLTVAAGEVQTLGLRSNQRFNSAELVVSNACLLGLRLLPLSAAGEAPEPLPITENLQNDAVVNVLASTAERLPQNGELQAPWVGADDGPSLIKLDGSQSDWDALTGLDGVEWTTFSTISYDENCANRYPDSSNLTDLEARVQLAYDVENLYAAFIVNDDGVITYTGPDERYFLGDSPQLLLDLDLNGDFDDARLSPDDVEIDLYPDFDLPRAAFWQLNTLSSRQFTEAIVVTTATDTGYFLEAALPWQMLNTTPQPGDRLGIVASINDNDTPETNAQECIITTSPQLDWRNPTTWGTLFLMPIE
jgi:hypothetical protein